MVNGLVFTDMQDVGFDLYESNLAKTMRDGHSILAKSVSDDVAITAL